MLYEVITIHCRITTITWKIAPAPIERNITADNGENAKPPTQEPNIAGIPAIRPNKINLRIIDFSLDSGAAIARPSVVLCRANPTIKNVLNAIEPNPIEAPIASPSPKLCRLV